MSIAFDVKNGQVYQKVRKKWVKARTPALVQRIAMFDSKDARKLAAKAVRRKKNTVWDFMSVESKA